MNLPAVEDVPETQREEVWNRFVKDWTNQYGIDLERDQLNASTTADISGTAEQWCLYARENLEEEQSRARKLLYFGNKELAPFTVHKYFRTYAKQNDALTIDDFIQKARQTLWEVTDQWSDNGRSSFSTYAIFHMRRNTLRSLQHDGQRSVIPDGSALKVQRLYSKMRRFEHTFEHKHGRKPTSEEIQDELGITEAEYEKITFYEQERHESLSAPKGEDRTLEDILGRNDAPLTSEERHNITNEIRSIIYKAAPGRSDRNASITTHYLFGQPGRTGPIKQHTPTLETVGEAHGLTIERVRQVKEDVLDAVHNYITANPEQLPFDVNLEALREPTPPMQPEETRLTPSQHQPIDDQMYITINWTPDDDRELCTVLTKL